MRNRIALFTVAIGLSLTAFVRADDNVRDVQEKLRDGGFYSGEIDGAYSSDLSAALSRYQIRNGLPITGQLDVETSKALGAKPAVGPSAPDSEQSSSETWRRLRKHERRTSTEARRSETQTSSSSAGETENSTEMQPRSAPAATETASSESAEPASAARATRSEQSTEIQPRSAPATARTSSETTITEPASAPPVTVRSSSETAGPVSAPPAASSADEFSSERVRDYVAAFVLAGLDKNVGAETEFYADRVQYYDQGIMGRESIREDLKRYDQRWPERHFWVAGAINIEPQSDNRVRVTFPLGFKLRNANRQSSGKVDKTLVLERTGDDLQIVAVNERKAE
jgi:peptidoglycan hydrolase-like protein with peptidoglycan-binding domain